MANGLRQFRYETETAHVTSETDKLAHIFITSLFGGAVRRHKYALLVPFHLVWFILVLRQHEGNKRQFTTTLVKHSGYDVLCRYQTEWGVWRGWEGMESVFTGTVGANHPHPIGTCYSGIQVRRGRLENAPKVIGKAKRRQDNTWEGVA